LVYFTKCTETGGFFNRFRPNRRAFGDLIESSGFVVNTVQDDGRNWVSMSASEGQRTFTPGLLESWNEAATMPRTG
jgi:hypothetical protein